MSAETFWVCYFAFWAVVAWPLAATLWLRHDDVWGRGEAIAITFIPSLCWPLLLAVAILGLPTFLLSSSRLGMNVSEREREMERKVSEQSAELHRVRMLAREHGLPWFDEPKR